MAYIPLSMVPLELDRGHMRCMEIRNCLVTVCVVVSCPISYPLIYLFLVVEHEYCKVCYINDCVLVGCIIVFRRPKKEQNVVDTSCYRPFGSVTYAILYWVEEYKEDKECKIGDVLLCYFTNGCLLVEVEKKCG